MYISGTGRNIRSDSTCKIANRHCLEPYVTWTGNSCIKEAFTAEASDLTADESTVVACDGAGGSGIVVSVCRNG